MKSANARQLLTLVSGLSEPTEEKCFVEVLPGDTQGLLEAMASTEKGCVLQLQGEYVFSTSPPTISHRLQAAAPDIDQKGDALWYLPAFYEEDDPGIFTDSVWPEAAPAVTGAQPAATLVIERGVISLDAEGELHNIGIIDKRPEASTGLPALMLTQPSAKPVHERLHPIFFDHPYPLVSDISDDHPYWNHEEAADQAGNTARTGVRYLSSLMGGSLRRAGPGKTGSRGGGVSGNGGGDDPYKNWWWRLEQMKKRAYSSSGGQRGSWAAVFLWGTPALILAVLGPRTIYWNVLLIKPKLSFIEHEIREFDQRKYEMDLEHGDRIRAIARTIGYRDKPQSTDQRK